MSLVLALAERGLVIDVYAIVAYVIDNYQPSQLTTSIREYPMRTAAAKTKRTVTAQPRTAARSSGLPVVKRDRLHVRLDTASRHKIEQAAHYLNKTASEFVLSQAVIAADKVIDSQGHTITLRAAEWDRFYRALENPPKPNRKLMEAARRYAKRGGELVG